MEGRQIAELLAAHEETIACLYQAFGRRFTEHAEFWNRLAEEEKQHAFWIERFIIRIENGDGIIKPERFNPSVVADSIAAIEQIISNVSNPDVTLNDAVSFAVRCEKNIIEGRFYELFEGNCAEVKQMQYALDLVVREHYDRIHSFAESNCQ